MMIVLREGKPSLQQAKTVAGIPCHLQERRWVSIGSDEIPIHYKQ